MTFGVCVGDKVLHIVSAGALTCQNGNISPCIFTNVRKKYTSLYNRTPERPSTLRNTEQLTSDIDKPSIYSERFSSCKPLRAALRYWKAWVVTGTLALRDLWCGCG